MTGGVPTACTFSSLIWPDGSAPAALASLLFDPPEPQIIGKTQCFATFLRASASSFFWLFLFSDLLSSTLLFSLTLPISAFHLSILSEVWNRNFLRLYTSYLCQTNALQSLARSTFRSQNAQNTPGSDHFWKLRCRKHISKSKCTKPCTDHFWELRCRKCACRCGAKHILKSKMYKTPHVRATFGRSDVVSRGRRKGLWTLSKVSKTSGFCSISKNDGRRGTFEEDLQRCIFRGRRGTRDMFIRAVRRSGRWFPERGCILEHQVFRFAKMILRDRCSTSYDLASLSRGRRNTLDRWTGKIAKRIGTRPSALHSTFHFWRKSRRILSFLMLSTSKNEEVSQNCFVFDAVNFKILQKMSEEVSQKCFVFDVVNFEKSRSLAELLRFWSCHVQTLRTSRRIASFLMMSTLKNEEVSQNCCVFDVVNFEKWRSLAE